MKKNFDINQQIASKFFPKIDFYDLPEFHQVERKLKNILGKNKGPIADICQHLLSAKGKRIRPLLVCLSGKLYKINTEDLVDCAVAIELIHMASLVHDDIIDKANTRRGLPSINKLWGNHIAVLAGDFLFAKAFNLLSLPYLSEVMRVVTKTIDIMCHGEIEQALAKGELSQTKEDYFERIDKKTGKLIATSCSIGPLMGKSTHLELTSLKNYGRYLGSAFQIIDDLLNFQGDKALLGKETETDLEQGHLTLPILLLLNDPVYKEEVKSILSNNPLPSKEKSRLMQILKSSTVLDASFAQAVKLIEEAKEELSVFQPSWIITAFYSLADSILENFSEAITYP